MKPRIFIGSSTEGLAVAERIKNFFDRSMNVKFGMMAYSSIMITSWIL